MKAHTLVAWTGPCAVKEVAEKLRGEGVAVKVEGTENIYVTFEGETPRAASETLTEKLRRTSLRWLDFRGV